MGACLSFKERWRNLVILLIKSNQIFSIFCLNSPFHSSNRGLIIGEWAQMTVVLPTDMKRQLKRFTINRLEIYYCGSTFNTNIRVSANRIPSQCSFNLMYANNWGSRNSLIIWDPWSCRLCFGGKSGLAWCGLRAADRGAGVLHSGGGGHTGHWHWHSTTTTTTGEKTLGLLQDHYCCVPEQSC